MIICNKTVNLIVKYSETKIYYYNDVKGYSIAEGKYHFKNPVNNLPLHIPEAWVAVQELE